MKSILKVGLGLALVLGLFVAGEFAQRLVAYRDAWGGDAPVAAARHLVLNLFQRVPHPLDDAALEESGLPVYELRVGRGDLNDLRRTAEEVSTAKYSTEIPRDYVDAKFLRDGRWEDIEIKLRGKTSAHYNRQRPSLRLSFPKNHPLHGKQQINLCRTTDKGVTKDLTTNWELSRYGIMTWESQFAVLKINGEVVGVFQEIEQMGRAMIDRSRRSEGFIFSGTGQSFGATDGLAWEKAQSALRWFIACKDQAGAPAQMGPCTWPRVEEYLDTDRFAWAAAQATLVGSSHAWSADNTRIYYDPARGKFEPIPWDFLGYPIDPAVATDGETCISHGTALLRLPEFRRMRDKRLWTLMTERLQPMTDYANEVFASLEKPFDCDHRSPKYWGEKQTHETFVAALQDNSSFLSKLFESHDLTAAGSRSDEGRFVVCLENSGKAFVEVSEIALTSNGQRELFVLPEPQLVAGQWQNEPGRARIELPSGALANFEDEANVQLAGVTARNDVNGVEIEEKDLHIVQTTTPKATREPTNTPERPRSPDLPANVLERGNELVFGPEPVVIESTWEIPSRYSVRFMPGLKLSFADGASLIIYGDLTAIGTDEAPIQVAGQTSKHGWGALAVQGTRSQPRSVHLEHVQITGGTGAQNTRSFFTGALSVTDGKVVLRDCAFIDGGSIDGINLKYCEVDLRRNLVRGSADDSVDLDFCTGEVVGNRVVESGGDGLDFSGSDLLVENNAMEKCADKGISVGEATIARIKNNVILHCRTGVAVKDGSTVHLEATGMAHLEVGVALYCKKLTFGAPTVGMIGIAMADTSTAILRGPDTTLTVYDSVRYVSDTERSSAIEGLENVPYDEPLSIRALKTLLVASNSSRPARGVVGHDQIPW